MTPAQLDHLRRIDAHLVNLLDIAAKRTPGEWQASDNVCTAAAVEDGYFITCDSAKTSMITDANNAAFIAACAGNAEAGWRATRAAIAALSKIAEEREPVEHGDSGDGPYVSMFRTSAAHFAEQTLNDILAAFPNV